jgi:predicted enzyme related to lactoylglutathione lyase
MFTLRGKYVAAASPPQQEDMPAHWTTYLASDDVDDTATKIRDAGGTVLADPFDVFDSGRMTVAQDPTGAIFGVWQAHEHIGAQLANDPGTLTWNQCQTNDPARAAAFYQAVFGYEIDEVDMGGEHPFRVLKVGGRGVAGVREPISADEPTHWSTTFAVADTDETVARAKELGGTVVMEPLDLPDIGRLAVLQDSTGAAFQVIKSAG